ncbi:MAG: GNAT family N-acetyltransferase [Actinomycetes bacterium]
MTDENLIIFTKNLALYTVTPDDYELLAVNREDPLLWQDRGFTNPYRHLVDDPGPLPYRIPRIRSNPDLAKYLLRLAVYQPTKEIVGSSGFHSEPDEFGMIEIGLGLVPEYRGRGLAQELLHGMWEWVTRDPLVKVLRYTVSPSNEPSQAIIKKLGFEFMGQQIDEEDGPEDIFEMSAQEYRVKFAK